MTQTFDNYFTSQELKEKLTQSFIELDTILIEHSGPFANNAVIGSDRRQVNDVDEFTKDGIKILKHLIVSEDVFARFAARMTRFVGIAVDARCHDGTTTSMLLFCRLAIIALEHMDCDFLSKDRYLWSKTLIETFNMCLDYLSDIKITEEEILDRCHQFGIETSLPQVRAALAYHMAMIASKGDDNLSSKVSAVIKSSPRKIFGMFKDSALAVETKEAYHLKKQEYDISVNANIGLLDTLNYKNDTQYLSEDAVIFATGNDIVSRSMEALFLTAFISQNPRFRGDLLPDFGTPKGWEELHGGKKNLIILTPILNDIDLITEINIFNANNPQVKITWFNMQVNHLMRTSLNKTIHYLAGCPIFTDVLATDPSQSLVGMKESAVKAHMLGNVLTLSHLYQKDGEVFHPFYRDPKLYEPYTKFARETEEMITFAQENVTNPSLDKDNLTYLTSLYRSLTTQEIYDIEVGGSAHDQYANRTVYEDAIGAALSGVNDGVVLGGYAHLANHFSGDSDIAVSKFAQAFFSVVNDSLRVDKRSGVVEDLSSALMNKWHYLVADMDRYETATREDQYIKIACLDKEHLQLFLKCQPGIAVLFQAYTGYEEQFNRFKDMLPKLARSTTFIDMRLQGDPSNVR